MTYIPKQALVPAKKPKYRNRKVTSFGLNFDSAGERDRYYYLKDAQDRGLIRNLKCQVRYTISVNREKICDYIADFVYDKSVSVPPSQGSIFQTIVEDFKGLQTDVFKLKRKLMRAALGIEIKIVKKPTEEI